MTARSKSMAGLSNLVMVSYTDAIAGSDIIFTRGIANVARIQGLQCGVVLHRSKRALGFKCSGRNDALLEAS